MVRGQQGSCCESNSSILEERVENDSATSEACGVLVTFSACSRL